MIALFAINGLIPAATGTNDRGYHPCPSTAPTAPAAAALAAYLRSEIDDRNSDEETLDLRTKDRSLVKVSLQIWHYYCDIRAISGRASPECSAIPHPLSRLPPQRPRRSRQRRHQNDYAPFPTDALWQAHQHLIEPDRLPAYDPAQHARNNYLDEAQHRRNNLLPRHWPAWFFCSSFSFSLCPPAEACPGRAPLSRSIPRGVSVTPSQHPGASRRGH